ncbi:Hypothetical predicted protein [Paramuricea clavata]|uniref:Uncharacterized protein n=1 Tax=Paramuricea clavata TaxID=317549 RepID=A0A7D9LDR6_PARCT|nr:Hypothetical predicted protein [Paramuricea clavata]
MYDEDLKKYEDSTDNMLRSIAVYYSKGIMGKDEYMRVYKASSYRQKPGKKRAAHIKVANCPSHRLMAYIKSIDIGQLHSVHENMCNRLDECDKVNGCYRDIEDLLVKLAKFYLNHELPNDMKMLAFLAGSSLTVQLTFPLLQRQNKESLTKIGTFGHNASDTWKPWKYSDRVKVINAIEKFKKKIKHKTVSANTKRSNITFIAKQKNWQEFVPLVAESVD